MPPIKQNDQGPGAEYYCLAEDYANKYYVTLTPIVIISPAPTTKYIQERRRVEPDDIDPRIFKFWIALILAALLGVFVSLNLIPFLHWLFGV